ncbi:Hypothetical predicted protein [Podarcis lilfordi]|uniref:Uncharacterized protein n=1 Tax=Podarcis lilfordi TaxID=74358 RepID=A0AA35LKI1_9SAUR|nr:Hypothetical predicted protein [Podarcis lilfordi]
MAPSVLNQTCTSQSPTPLDSSAMQIEKAFSRVPGFPGQAATQQSGVLTVGRGGARQCARNAIWRGPRKRSLEVVRFIFAWFFPPAEMALAQAQRSLRKACAFRPVASDPDTWRPE